MSVEEAYQEWRTQVDKRFKALLLALEMIADGKTQAWNPSGAAQSHAKATGGNRPPGTLHPPQDSLKRAYIACEDDRCRLRVIKEAEQELAHAKRRQSEVVVESREERDARIVGLLRKGWSEAEVAQAEGLTVRVVRLAWREAQKVEVKRWKGQGKSVRFIAERVGVPYATVHRLLKEL